MALSIRIKGLDACGVELLSPIRPEFDELARPLLGERIADIGLTLKPMLVIVSNDSNRTVVSLSLVWRVTHRDGRTRRHWGHTSFPEVICGDVLLNLQPAGLETGQRRIEANGLVIHRWGYLDEYYDQFLGQFVDQKDALLADAVELHIELNAVIFADGTLIGPDDQSALTDLFSTYVRAKQGWYAASSRRWTLVSQLPNRSHQSSDSWPTLSIEARRECVRGREAGRSMDPSGRSRGGSLAPPL